jgi:site-specific DNA-methyltransferase (adenine-specific)
VKPYYEDASCVIYHGDSLEYLASLADASADAIVTDPPYGVEFRGEAWDREIPDWIEQGRRVAPVVLFTTAPLTVWDYPRADWVICWARPASSSRSLIGGFNHWSPVLVYGKPKFPVDAFSLHAIANSAPKWNTHPSPKPEKLYQWLIGHATTAGQLIVDPFMGSGTTLVAAKLLSRRAVGVEMNEGFCELAARRLSQESLELGA